MLNLGKLFCVLSAPSDDGGTGGDSTGDNQTGDQTSTTDAQDKEKAGKDHTSGINTMTAEQLRVEFVKLKEANSHLLGIHTEMKTKAEKREKAELEAKNKALEEQGKYKELYEKAIGDFEKTKSRGDVLETALKGYYEEAAKELPDNLMALIPENDPVENKLAWITKFRSNGLLNIDKKKTGGDGSPPAGSDPLGTFEDRFKKKR